MDKPTSGCHIWRPTLRNDPIRVSKRCSRVAPQAHPKNMASPTAVVRYGVLMHCALPRAGRAHLRHRCPTKPRLPTPSSRGRPPRTAVRRCNVTRDKGCRCPSERVRRACQTKNRTKKANSMFIGENIRSTPPRFFRREPYGSCPPRRHRNAGVQEDATREMPL